MATSAESKLVQYHRQEIDGWELISWAATVDPKQAEDGEALERLTQLDSFHAKGYHRSVERLLLRMIPQNRRERFGEILIDGAVNRLETGTLSSADFMAFFLDTFYNEIDEAAVESSDWIYRFFNENNGYGFPVLERMSRHDLLTYIKGLQDTQNRYP